ncbi:MAG TPA: hypothetical protein VGM89_15930, partial [Puia sp.]
MRKPQRPSSRKSSLFPALSIRQQLPLLICLLLIVLIALFGSISYLSVKQASMAVGEQRLRTLTEELSSMFQQSGHNLATGTQALARQEDIVNYFAGDTAIAGRTGRALAALRKTLGDSQTIRVELRDPLGKVLLAAGRGASEHDQGLAPSTETGHRWTEPDVSGELTSGGRDSSFVGRLYLAGDSMSYPIIARVYRGDKLQGTLWR